MVVSASDTNMVSDVGCFGFSKKPKTVLSTKNQEYKMGSESQNIVLQFYPSDNTELAVGPGKNSSEILSDEQFLSVSKYLGLSQTDVHADAEPPPIDCKGEKTDAFNCHFESSDSTGRVRSDATEKQKTLQPSVLSTVNAENVAWSMLPNGRQFIGSKESLVDHNNIHLFMNDA